MFARRATVGSIADEQQARGWKLGVEDDLEEMFVAVTLAGDVVEHLGRERRHVGEAVDSSTGLTMLNDE